MPLAAGVLAWICWLACAPMGQGQAPPSDPQNKPSDPQKPPTTTPKPEANPFPEDTNSVPVLPNAGSPATAGADSGESAAGAPAPSEDSDPVRSPDDPVADSSSSSGESSSAAGMDKLLPAPDADTKTRRGNRNQPPQHQETAAEDVNVGSYYLSIKNWKAALSRFESGAVLDPENPDVYWGMAEAQRHLGDFAAAKANYLKVLDYDPDGKHGKDARKALKEPELANAPTASATRPPASSH